jgi:Ca2+-transporting ATPase
MWIDMGLIGSVIGLGTLAAFYFALPDGLEEARTVAFATLIMFQMFNVYNIRSETRSIFSRQTLRNKYLHLSVLVSILLLVAVVHLPFLQRIFETTVLDGIHWVYVIGVSALVVIVFEIKKALKL